LLFAQSLSTLATGTLIPDVVPFTERAFFWIGKSQESTWGVLCAPLLHHKLSHLGLVQFGSIRIPFLVFFHQQTEIDISVTRVEEKRASLAMVGARNSGNHVTNDDVPNMIGSTPSTSKHAIMLTRILNVTQWIGWIHTRSISVTSRRGTTQRVTTWERTGISTAGTARAAAFAAGNRSRGRVLALVVVIVVAECQTKVVHTTHRGLVDGLMTQGR
jgi:hypothetical protein